MVLSVRLGQIFCDFVAISYYNLYVSLLRVSVLRNNKVNKVTFQGKVQVFQGFSETDTPSSGRNSKHFGLSRNTKYDNIFLFKLNVVLSKKNVTKVFTFHSSIRPIFCYLLMFLISKRNWTCLMQTL